MASKPYSYKYFSVHFVESLKYVVHVEINRVDKLNAFIEPMWFEMRELFNQLSSDSSVRAIVISGAGDKAFTAGLDVKAASKAVSSQQGNADTARRGAYIRRYIHRFQDCISAIERCEKPVIAAMHGHSLGFAIDLSTAADVRVCTKDVRFSVKEVDIGMAADIGVLNRLPKVVGNFSWVKEVSLSARLFGAAEALRVGFVSAVHESKSEMIESALQLAGLIAQKSPVAVQGTKELLNWSRDHPTQEALRYTAVWNSAAVQTADISAALLSGLQKRTPTFENL
ncbi:delta(3,5)-Delta(2,4)-dienoyl-CoA isomerase, mitochondrial [Aspergillus udagawae]|nr:delta(3,5)-Delta(2,4)-dienoyl-CoA isomerase, mitochondrial [Aspergillus udagawae]